MKIVIAGGVAGGASTAARARRLDENAEIIVLERDYYVSYANCGLPYHISGVIADPGKAAGAKPQRSLRENLNLAVRIGHELTAIDRDAKTVQVRNLATGESYSETYDKLVLALGATPIRPRLPGIDLPNIHVLRNIPDMDGIMAASGSHTRRSHCHWRWLHWG